MDDHQAILQVDGRSAQVFGQLADVEVEVVPDRRALVKRHVGDHAHERLIRLLEARAPTLHDHVNREERVPRRGDLVEDVLRPLPGIVVRCKDIEERSPHADGVETPTMLVELHQQLRDALEGLTAPERLVGAGSREAVPAGTKDGLVGLILRAWHADMLAACLVAEGGLDRFPLAVLEVAPEREASERVGVGERLSHGISSGHWPTVGIDYPGVCGPFGPGREIEYAQIAPRV